MRNVIAKRSVDGDDVTVTLDVFGETDDVGELPPELGGPAPGDDEDEPARFFTAMVKVERAGGKAMSFQVELEQGARLAHRATLSMRAQSLEASGSVPWGQRAVATLARQASDRTDTRALVHPHAHARCPTRTQTRSRS